MRAAQFLLLGLLLVASRWQLEACPSIEQRFQFGSSGVYVRLLRSAKLQYQLMKGARTLQTITLDNLVTNNNLEPTTSGSLKLTTSSGVVEFQLVSSSSDMTHVRVSREDIARNAQPRDCFSLDMPHTHWYAGPEDHTQYWPVEKLTFSNYSYLTKEADNAALSERYWVNSNGVFVYVEEDTPLFVDQNSAGYENQLCFSAIAALPYDARMPKVSFVYHVGFGADAKIAHRYAVQNLLGKPTGTPDERMTQHPIWSTWAIYKANISEEIVRDFAQQIIANGFNNSQLEIDDDWEECYGALTFDKSKFPAMKQLTDDLKAMGFRVTLWIHPFINKDCTAIYEEALQKGFLVLNHNGSADTKWWNSQAGEAAYVDFTKPAAQQWFSARLKLLQTEDGIDSFKFDAGETSWVPDDPVLQGALSTSPNQITSDYVRTVGAFGPMIEVRTGQGTQDMPIYVRMLDKDSGFDWNNGLTTLITTLMQMNLNGYPFVLPDMIGGNGYYNTPPTKELFLRWIQANVFMPSMQFSYVPWGFDNETVAISKKFTQLHSAYTPYILQRFKLAVESGDPVNPPLWWVDPADEIAQGIYDQFLLGEDIIAAPVIVQGAVVRDIYLPQGQWQDGNTDAVHTGPIWLMSYDAPLDTLPYFVRVGAQLS